MLDIYPKEIKLVHKDTATLPHTLGHQAAIAALAAGEQNKFWEYHDKVMQHASMLSAQKFLDFAKELNLDMGAFQKSLKDPKHEKHIDKDQLDAIKTGIGGVAIFVNGRAPANLTLDGLKAMINEELKKK